jgi:hypothetical protein
MIDWSKIKYFKPWEFESPDLPGSGERVSPALIAKLEGIRTEVGFPLMINSGCRTYHHNKEVGGAENSAHLIRGNDELCEAVDIKALSGRQRYRIVQVALKYGITRIGIGKSFVHLDVDEDLPQHVIWRY